MIGKPEFWKTSMEEMEKALKEAKLGKTSVLTYSAGKRPVHVLEYGDKKDLGRKANYSSACGAHDPEYYAKKGGGIPPIILMVGNTHGGELEGTAAILNLIRIIETGSDFRGKTWDFLYENWTKFRLILIPCHNPDGRARIPVDSFWGMKLEQMRYYLQGTWKDGSLCKWPECKSIHPINGHVDFMGAYFNDNGVNMMHDNFFSPMAEETKALMELVDKEAPDFSLLLHGGANCVNHFTPTNYVPFCIKEKIWELSRRILIRSKREGLQFQTLRKNIIDGDTYPPSYFNLTSAIYHICGGVSVLYESNMGLDAEGERYTYDQILDSHLILFEELLKYALEQNIK